MQWPLCFVLIVGQMMLVTSDILHQLDILSAKDVVEEGESVTLKCRDHQMRKHNNILVNLYKNGEKLQIKPSTTEMGLFTFNLENIRQEQTGNYTCFYEEKTPENVTHIRTENFLSLTVKPSVLTLQAEKKKSVQGGLDLTFKCFFPKGKKIQNPPHTFELYENGVQIKSESVGNKLGAEFTVKNVNETIDVTYICKYKAQRGFTIQSQQYGLQHRGTENTTKQVEPGGRGTSVLDYWLARLTSVPGLYIVISFGAFLLLLLIALLIKAIIKCSQSKKASDRETEGNSSEGPNNTILYSVLEHKETSTKMPRDAEKVVYAKLGPQITTQNSPVDSEIVESA
ncbi:uncharacterized protein LOC120536706 [Polypterus senegalus]|uniref:uncharacterized protein LOC120536706 n=1 Tax=Polypterus senegalus TaxID=55291 RepID=UPI0019659588|nr:uncharacterized protein LOC120536706 [Polypterus senegalus]